MRAVRRYQQGGEVRSLLERLAAQSSPRRPEAVASPAMAPNYLGKSNFDQVSRIVDAIESGEDIVYDPSLSPAIAEERKFRDRARRAPQTRFADVDGMQVPMESGAVRSVSPMKFVSPVGDVEDMFSGLQMAGRGVKEGDLGKVAGGAGLSLAAGAMAFLPGNLSMVRSYAQSVNNPMLDRIFKGIGEGEDFEQVISNVAGDFTKAERAATAKDAQDLIDLSFDEFSGLDLSNTEMVLLEEIKDLSTKETAETSLKLAPSIQQSRSVGDLPDDINGFEKRIDNYDTNEVSVSYTDIAGNFGEINSGSVTEKVPQLSDVYGDRYAHTLNMDFTELKERPGATFKDQRTQSDVLNTLFSNIEKGDLIGIPPSGSLSSDSYPMILRQIKKGNRYQAASKATKEGIRDRGVKVIDKVGQDRSIDYRSLNDMGQFSNYFGIPKDALIDGMLTGKGGSFKARESFGSAKEANDYLKQLKEKYIDPKLKEVGLPPARIAPNEKAEGYTKILFPYPVLEKLRLGGKLKVKKKRKKGMRAKKR